MVSQAYQLAVDARDRRFDGVFFVAITTTRVYCRPCCPSRLALGGHRRFFDSAAAAEQAGFRPCLRCRPELAPGRSATALSHLAQVAAERIAAGALNGRSVAEFAAELDVSERQLRRAFEREVRVSPLELAQTHRLLLAKRLIVDTDLPMTRVAYASGFQSLRRFNTVFRAQYRMAPSALRRGRPRASLAEGTLRLTLAYRPPLAWESLASLPSEAQVSIGAHRGCVSIENSAPDAQLVVQISETLLPVLMPLIAGLRRVYDLDAEPALIDAHLAASGLAHLVKRWPGVRVPGQLAGLEGADPDAVATSDRALLARAEAWRPWRAYAAQLLKLAGDLDDRPVLARSAHDLEPERHAVRVGAHRKADRR